MALAASRLRDEQYPEIGLSERVQSERQSPQAHRVVDHAHRTQRHGGCCHDGRQQDADERTEQAGPDRHARCIVGEGPEQVLSDVAHRRLRQAPRLHDAHQATLEEGYAGTFDDDIGAGAHAVDGDEYRRCSRSSSFSSKSWAVTSATGDRRQISERRARRPIPAPNSMPTHGLSTCVPRAHHLLPWCFRSDRPSRDVMLSH